MQLHTRANWSGREDRRAAVVWLGLLWIGMLAGFGMDVRRYLHEDPAAPAIVNFHAVVYTIWMFVLTALVVLVEQNQVKIHRTLGWFAAGWVVLMAVVGPWAILSSQAVNLHNPALSSPQFLSVALSNVLCFVGLVICGILLRKNMAAHRRLMILSTAAMADPGFSRITGMLLPEPHSIPLWYFSIYWGDFLIIALIFLWDWKKGRVMKQYVMAASAVLVAEITASCLYFWGPWAAVTRSWLRSGRGAGSEGFYLGMLHNR